MLGIGRPIGPNKADQVDQIKDLPVGKVGQFSIGFSYYFVYILQKYEL